MQLLEDFDIVVALQAYIKALQAYIKALRLYIVALLDYNVAVEAEAGGCRC